MKVAVDEETAKSSTNEAIPYKLQEIDVYKPFSETVIKRANEFDFEDESILAADFEHDLKMQPHSMLLFKEFVASEVDTEMKRGDGSDIKCIHDMTKYVMYLKRAKEAAALPAFKPELSSGFNPMWRRRHSYKKCLNKVTEIAKLYTGKQAKVSPTADFEQRRYLSFCLSSFLGSSS